MDLWKVGKFFLVFMKIILEFCKNNHLNLKVFFLNPFNFEIFERATAKRLAIPSDSEHSQIQCFSIQFDQIVPSIQPSLHHPSECSFQLTFFDRSARKFLGTTWSSRSFPINRHSINSEHGAFSIPPSNIFFLADPSRPTISIVFELVLTTKVSKVSHFNRTHSHLILADTTNVKC